MLAYKWRIAAQFVSNNSQSHSLFWADTAGVSHGIMIWEVIISLYLAFMRPQLESLSSFGHHIKNVGENSDKNGKTNKRLETMTSEDRLKELGFSSQETWNSQLFFKVLWNDLRKKLHYL